MSDCPFVHNGVQGGTGGAGGTGAAGGAGGSAQGGAIWNVLAFGVEEPFVTSLTVRDSNLNQNRATGGAGGAGGAAGAGGTGAGGATPTGAPSPASGSASPAA